MKIGFLLESIGLSGGVNVVFEYASRLKKYGIDVVIITPQKFSVNSYSWFPDYKELNVVSDEEALSMDFDVVFATFWKTVFRLYKFKAKKYAYYVQSIENRFFKSKEEEYYNFCELTYLLNLDTITEATWIQKYFKDNYNRDVHLVRNGIRKENYNEDRVIEKRPEKGIRILVEGNLDQWFKNIRRTIEICNKSECKDIWLLTSSKVDKIEGVSRVFSQVNVKDVDVILVGGGNTFHLLNQVRLTGFDELLKTVLEDKVYMGISAGSILATPSIAIASVDNGDENLCGITDLSGLSLVDFEVSPHTPEDVSMKGNEEYSRTISNVLYTLDDNSAIEVNGKEIKVISEGIWHKLN